MRIIRKILWIVFLLLISACLFAFGYYLAATKDAVLIPNKLLLSEKTITIYDENNVIVKNTSQIFQQQTISYKNLPLHTKNAFISTEDKRFYSHKGFDVKRIAKAALNNLKSHSFKEGASTISQQLIKNTHLSQEKTLKRKLKEWKLTRQLEKKYSKSEILEKYLNTIYFGHSCFGIHAASEFYFGKSPENLNLSESAILAGLVKSPNNYSPFKNPQNCQRRKACVLSLMQQNGVITKTEKQRALNEPLPIQNNHTLNNTGYLHYVFDELTELSDRHGFQVGGNVEIHTYLDQTIQNKLETLSKTITDCDKNILVLSNAAHGFKACVSSTGEIPRLPGSLIKPLLVYTPALEEDLISPATPILDEKVNYNGYAPENYDGNFHGYVSVRECVEKSLNIPAVKTLSSLTVKKGAQYLEKLGLPVSDADRSLALALGGMQKGYSLKELLSAYSVFPNEGVLQPCGFISKIRINGVNVYTKPNNSSKVFSKESAYLMTDMLKSTAQKGTAKKLRSLPFDIAAKTGTVGTQKGNTDAYAIAFTPKDSAAVWLGNKDNANITHTGGGLPCNLLFQIHELLYTDYKDKKQPIPSFVAPENVTKIDLDKIMYYDTHTISLADDQSPVEYRLQELFKKQAIPQKKSENFSNPSIYTPKILYNNGKVTIQLERAPSYYKYKIERYDYVTHTTLYYGGPIQSFIDPNVSPNKNYIYTVTPIYKENYGKKIVLPTISTKNAQENTTPQKDIENDSWWNY